MSWLEWTLRSPGEEVRGLRKIDALLEIVSADRLSIESMLSSLCRVAGKERGLLYARRAMSVRPARRKVRSAVVVRGFYRY